MATPAKTRQTYTVEAIPKHLSDGAFLGDPTMDKMMSCMIAIGTELWATQYRLKVMESVMATKGITNELIEQYMPSAAQVADWERDRDRFVDLTFGALGDDAHLPAYAPYPKS